MEANVGQGNGGEVTGKNQKNKRWPREGVRSQRDKGVRGPQEVQDKRATLYHSVSSLFRADPGVALMHFRTFRPSPLPVILLCLTGLHCAQIPLSLPPVVTPGRPSDKVRPKSFSTFLSAGDHFPRAKFLHYANDPLCRITWETMAHSVDCVASPYN